MVTMTTTSSVFWQIYLLKFYSQNSLIASYFRLIASFSTATNSGYLVITYECKRHSTKLWDWFVPIWSDLIWSPIYQSDQTRSNHILGNSYSRCRSNRHFIPCFLDWIRTFSNYRHCTKYNNNNKTTIESCNSLPSHLILSDFPEFFHSILSRNSSLPPVVLIDSLDWDSRSLLIWDLVPRSLNPNP